MQEKQNFLQRFPEIIKVLTEDLGHPEIGDVMARLKQVSNLQLRVNLWSLWVCVGSRCGFGGTFDRCGGMLYLGDSRSALEELVPRQVYFLTCCLALWFWRATQAALHGWRHLGVKALHLISLLL